MPLIENKWIKYALILPLMWIVIWKATVVNSSWQWKIFFEICATFGVWLYVEGYLTSLRQR